MSLEGGGFNWPKSLEKSRVHHQREVLPFSPSPDLTFLGQNYKIITFKNKTYA